MAFPNDAGKALAGNGIRAGVTHFSPHSGAPGAAGTSNAIGSSRFAVTWSAVVAGVFSVTVNMTGLGANQTVPYLGTWNASSAGTYYDSLALSQIAPNDYTANAAGDLSVTVTVTLP